MMLKREGYTERMGRRLDAWRRRFESRRTAAATQDAAVSADTRHSLEADKVAGDAAFEKLRELRSVAGRYAELRHEMSELWKAIDDQHPHDGAVVGAAAPARRTRGKPVDVV